MKPSQILRKAKHFPLNTFLHDSISYIRLGLFREFPELTKPLWSQDLSEEHFFNSLIDVNSVEGLVRLARNGFVPPLLPALKSKDAVHDELIFFRETFPEETHKLLTKAGDILKGRVSVLGSYELGGDYKTLPWHYDFVSGFRWDEKTPFFSVTYGDRDGVDVKIPWELSRFEYAVTLGQAYFLTGDERFALEFEKLVSDWINANRPGYGVNWCCTMEVAIRACNWLAAWSFLRFSDAISHDFTVKFFKSLYHHGCHIAANLEWTANHFLADLAGLLYISVLCPWFKESKKWRKIALFHLKRELKHQIYDDGIDYEASISYHRLVTDFYFFALWLCKLNQIDLPLWFGERVAKMCRAMAALVMSDGALPQIGDTDSGRSHVLGQRGNRLDCQDIMGQAAVFFGDAELKFKEWKCPPEVFWLFGREGIAKWQTLQGNPYLERKSKSFNIAGIYVMNNRDNHAVISCGPNGQDGNGGHAHNDKLSFDLVFRGEKLVADPGTYVYTRYPDVRNKFRGTAFHNTVIVNDEEQNRLGPGLFSMHDDAHATGSILLQTNEETVFEGRHYGYARLPAKIVHSRKIALLKDAFTVTDTFYPMKQSGTNFNVRLRWHLTLAPGVEVIDFNKKNETSGVSGLKLCTKKNAHFFIQFERDVYAEIKEGEYSPGYGLVQSVRHINWTLNVNIPFSFSWLIKAA